MCRVVSQWRGIVVLARHFAGNSSNQSVRCLSTFNRFSPALQLGWVNLKFGLKNVCVRVSLSLENFISGYGCLFFFDDFVLCKFKKVSHNYV